MGRRKEKITIRVTWVYQQHKVLYSINRLELHYSLFTLIPFNPFNPRGRGTKVEAKASDPSTWAIGLAVCSVQLLQFTVQYHGHGNVKL